MTDLERVARAIYSKIAWAYQWTGNTPYEKLNEHAKDVLADTAQRALTALHSAEQRAVIEAARKYRDRAMLNHMPEIGDALAALDAAEARND